MSISERFPEAIDKGKKREFPINEVYAHFQKFINPDSASISTSDVAQRYVCGFPVPDFQRPLCWSDQQMISFVESAILGIDIGTYTIHEFDFDEKTSLPLRFSDWLIDGQQRLYSLECYFLDKIKVLGFYWSELTKAEQRRFLNISFHQYNSSIWNEEEIINLYNKLAFGGTPHKESERA
jgi:uncharacterized protein with ParB-like and HNH nuclease domain